MDDSHESVVKSLNGNYNQICLIDVLGILHIVLMFSLHFIKQFTTTVIWHFSKKKNSIFVRGVFFFNFGRRHLGSYLFCTQKAFETFLKAAGNTSETFST